MSEFKSDRLVREEEKQYRYKRFEDYMKMSDDETLTRAIAIQAFKEECEYIVFIPEQRQPHD